MAKQDFEVTVDQAYLLFHFGPNFLKHRYVWDTIRHSNVSYEMHVILRGSCTAEVGMDTLTVSAGDIMIVAPGVYHAGRANDGPFERFTITFSAPDSALAPALQEAIDPYVHMEAPQEICELCRAIMSEYENEDAYRDDVLQCRLGLLLVYLLRQLSALKKRAEETGRGAIGNVSKDKTGMMTTIEYFFSHRMASYGMMQDLARRLRISKRQLCRLIPELYGMTFREKLLDTRMDYAAWMLRTTPKVISEICKQVGYTSESTFYTKFRQHYGMSPAQYRRKYQGTETETDTAPKGRETP